MEVDVATEEIKITVKSPKDKKEINISSNANVKQLKDIVAKEFSADLEQLCLIYAGKILKDTDRLATFGIKDDTTVHLVIKSANKAQDLTGPAAQQGSAIPRPEINLDATPFGLGGLGGLLGLSNLGFGSANFMDLQQQLQRNVFANPDLLRNLMENPMVRSLMSNPTLMQNLLSANPQMRELIEGIPEISRVLENPEMLQQAAQVAGNPAMLQELMRNSGGQSMFDMHSRNTREAQEPMLDAATSSQTSNAGNTAGGSDNQEDKDSASSGTNTSSNATSSFGVTNAGIDSITQQMIQNPQLMTNIMQAPYMQSMLQNLAGNPETINQYMNDIPLVPGDSTVQESVRSAMPSLAQQLVNPEIQSFIGNPRALQAMMDIQQGMQQLQSEAPGLLGEARPSSADQPTSTTTSGTAPVTTGNQTTAAAGDEYAQMLRQMFGVMSGATNPSTQPPEARYEIQLNQLAAMGFANRQANILALSATSGDLNAAVDRLLQQ